MPRQSGYMREKGRALMAQAALQIDTLAFSKKLRDAGASEELAEALVEGLAGATAPELVTKPDLDEAVAALDDRIGEMDAKIGAVREDVIAVKGDLHWIKLIGSVIVGLLVLPLLTDLATAFLN